MTAVVAVNADNDIYIDGTNNMAMLFGSAADKQGADAVAQACQTASRAQLGEMILFTTQGMPTKQSVFNSNPNLAVYQTALTAALLQVPGVISVQSIIFTKTGNVLNYVAVIQSQYGEIAING